MQNSSVWRSSLRSNGPFAAAIAIYVVISILASRIYDFHLELRLYSSFSSFMAPTATIIVAGLYSIYLLLRDRPQRPTNYLIQKASTWKIKRRLAYSLPVLIISPVFFSAFTSVKSAIPTMVPFYADPYFAEWDRIIFKQDAWRFFDIFLGFPIVVFVLNFFYHLWFFYFYLVLLISSVMISREELRAQYLLAFVLCWALLGSVLATVFSSVGPCYYPVFFGKHPYADLMQYLHEANRHYPIWALTAQDALLERSRSPVPGLANGISAFPSLHVAVAALNAIFAWRINFWFGGAATLFLIAIFLGSVQLGWHYAVDGIFSVICVPLIWYSSGRLIATGSRLRLLSNAKW